MMLVNRFLKSVLSLAVISGLLIGGSTTVNADEGLGSFSANVGIFSEYSFRGIDQSGEEAAIQGGFDWAHDSGFYLGTWGSNVDFNDNESVSEFDFYGGFSKELSNGVSIDLSLIGYTYPGAYDSSNYDFMEYAIGLGKSIGPVALSFAVNYSDEFFGESGDATYVQGGLDYELPQGVTLSAHVGHQSIDLETVYGAPDYVDYSVGGSYTLKSFDLSVTYVDTDVDDNWNSTDQSGKEGRAIFGVSRSF